MHGSWLTESENHLKLSDPFLTYWSWFIYLPLIFYSSNRTFLMLSTVANSLPIDIYHTRLHQNCTLNIPYWENHFGITPPFHCFFFHWQDKGGSLATWWMFCFSHHFCTASFYTSQQGTWTTPDSAPLTEKLLP